LVDASPVTIKPVAAAEFTPPANFVLVILKPEEA
jgi:hypothetical protein